MSNPHRALLGRAAWTIGSYGASLGLRFGTNVVMTWLLEPRLLGVMVVINSVRIGVELLTDVGIEQNIVHNPQGASAAFVDTAWMVQILRGAMLSGLFLALSGPLAAFFGIERGLFLAVSAAPFINSLVSTRLFVLVRNLDVKTRNLFELAAEALSFCVTVSLVAAHPTIWSMVVAILVSLAIRAGLSHALPGPRHRVVFRMEYVRQILDFGKWIILSSLVIYASTNIDRLFLAKAIPFAMLGIYGLARTIADLPPTLSVRLSYQIVFPAVAAARANGEGVEALSAGRWKFVALAAIGLGCAAAWSDLVIRLVYDPRYLAAGWMLGCLLVGSWFAVLSHLNEATLLGFGRPALTSLSNAVRLIVLAAGLPIGLAAGGLPGAIGAIVLSELCRYLSVLYGQARVGLTYIRQDLAATAIMVGCTLSWIGLRWWLGLGEIWTGIGQ